MSFESDFKEPITFSDCTNVISGYYSKEEAAEIMSEYYGEYIAPDSLVKDTVRFGFFPEHVDADDNGPAWYTGAKPGKGSKPVWVNS